MPITFGLPTSPIFQWREASVAYWSSWIGPVGRFWPGGYPILWTSHSVQKCLKKLFGSLENHGIDISVDGKVRWIDNVFVERLWRSVKYEDVYLKAYGSIAEARQRPCIKWTGGYL